MRIILCALVIFSTSCSMFKKSAPEPRRSQVRNIPINARTVGEDPRKRVFVFPFLDISEKRSMKTVQSSRNDFLKILKKTNKFLVIKNSDFPKDIESFKKDNTYNLQEMAGLANTLGVSSVMEGKILNVKVKRIGDQVGVMRKIRVQVEAEVQLRVYDAFTRKQIFNEKRTAKEETEITRVGEYAYSDQFLADDPRVVAAASNKAFRKMIPTLLKKLDKMQWQGRIALIRGDKIYLNAGRLSGLQVGDLLKVVDRGEDIYDPETGDYLGHAEGRMKGTIEVISYFGKDGSVAVIHSGAGFRENDQVELYQ